MVIGTAITEFIQSIRDVQQQLNLHQSDRSSPPCPPVTLNCYDLHHRVTSHQSESKRFSIANSLKGQAGSRHGHSGSRAIAPGLRPGWEITPSPFNGNLLNRLLYLKR